ncbi:hypothetical protein BaRGS_00019432 [Batillaria attramentaria]|uniref:Methionine--tRNA ligase, mitochondrial n=1 Tax=Batillaria attramentaria TaxID=370345 RepID=A0ABD0KQU8_9CAEN
MQLCFQKAYLTLKRHLHRSACCCQCMTSGTTPGRSDAPYFITTPIFYVNAAPHIGHLYSALVADASSRWQRLKGRQTLFTVGTDEHGLKIQQAAESHGKSPQQYSDEVSAKFQELFDKSGIAYDDFIRTTEPRHYRAVEKFWETLSKRGYIYRGQYEGWYCVSDEAFLTEEEVQDAVTSDGNNVKVSVASGQPVTWMTEENYMFRLSAFRQQLLSWLDSGAVRPVQFEALVRDWVDDLRDLSVSRQRERLSWGIPVPGDNAQTVYVWLDALVNYLTVAGYPDKFQPSSWPPTCQVIGKDILRFHAVYWPAFLFAADLPPPPSLLCHSHWLVEGHKMSKSRGNVVDPFDRLNKYSSDGLRYFLLKEGAYSSDGNYSDARAVERINGDLVNTMGNLLSRTTAPSVNKQQEFPPLDSGKDLQRFLSEDDVRMYTSLMELPGQVGESYESLSFPRAIETVMTHIRWANALVQTHQPWTLVKSCNPASQQHLKVVLHVAMETLRVCSILLQPVTPQVAARVLTRLGVPLDCSQVSHVHSDVCETPRSLGDKVTLMSRIQNKNGDTLFKKSAAFKV